MDLYDRAVLQSHLRANSPGTVRRPLVMTVQAAAAADPERAGRGSVAGVVERAHVTPVSFSATVDATAAGPVSLGTPAADFTPLEVIFQVAAAAGGVAPPEIGIGGAGGSYIDVFPATGLVSDAVGGHETYVLIGTAPAAGGVALFVNVATVATDVYSVLVTLNGVV